MITTSQGLPYAKANVGLNCREHLILDGSQSYDPDGAIIAWDWSLANQNPSRMNYMFSGEIVPLRNVEIGKYYVELVVTDHNGLTGRDYTFLGNSGVEIPVTPYSIQ